MVVTVGERRPRKGDVANGRMRERRAGWRAAAAGGVPGSRCFGSSGLEEEEVYAPGTTQGPGAGGSGSSCSSVTGAVGETGRRRGELEKLWFVATCPAIFGRPAAYSSPLNTRWLCLRRRYGREKTNPKPSFGDQKVAAK